MISIIYIIFTKSKIKQLFFIKKQYKVWPACVIMAELLKQTNKGEEMFFNTQNSISVANIKALTLSMAAGLLLMAISPATMAQQRISGGGNVIVCEQPNKAPRIVLLDYYDSIRKGGYGFKIDLGPGQTNEEKIKYVLDRLEKVDPFRANLYRKYAAEFENDMVISDKKSWGTPSSDLGNGYFLEEGCSVRRLAILRSDQEVMLSEDKKRYSISGFWEDMDETTKAGIKLHEIAYREALARGAEDSLNVRRYVALISSKEVLTADYAFEIAKSGLIFWGELVKNYEKYKSDYLPYQEGRVFLYNNSFPPATSWFRYAQKIVEFDSQNYKLEFDSLNNKNSMSIKIDGNNYSCNSLSINKHKASILELENIYQTLKSEKGLELKNLPDGVLISMGGCGDVRLTSEQFPDFKKGSFDLIFNTNVIVSFRNKKTPALTSFLIEDQRVKLNFSRTSISGRVRSGEVYDIDSVDLENKSCSLTNYSSNSVTCIDRFEDEVYSEKEYNISIED